MGACISCISAILSAWGFPSPSASTSTSTAATPTTDHSLSILQLPPASRLHLHLHCWHAYHRSLLIYSPIANGLRLRLNLHLHLLSTVVSPTTNNSTSTATNSCYDIFLNHRVEDTKKTFASHLYRGLVLHGFRVFWDKEEMQPGDTLTSQIETAIQNASVHVAIFSPKYAESNWCLEELHLMVKSGKPIIPVFYGVQPSEPRWIPGDGVYARALRILEGKKGSDGQPRYNSTTVQNWRGALSTVAGKSGLELERFNGDEGELLDKVVESVLETLNKTLKLNKRFDVGEHPTGLDEMITDFENTVLMQQQSGKPKVIGIVGFGDIGKTRLVQELFNRKSSDYSRSCFLSDVRGTARKNSLEYLQMKLLKGLTQLDRQIKSVNEGKQMLKNQLSSRQALVILVDVDHYDQLDALLRPIRDVLHSDSLVLITSGYMDVLTSSGVEKSSIYKLTGLNLQKSTELFCLHAFTQRHPLLGFEDLVDMYLRACEGRPLCLKVFGGLLYGKDDDRSFWKDHLLRLSKIDPHDSHNMLKISYVALQRDEKHMFLDIACFFIGEKKDTVVRIWDGSHWKGSLGFRSLQNKNLVDVVGTENEIRMHDHLRDLGRDIAKNPDLPLRIWRREDMDDLPHQSSEATEVRGIRMGRTEYEDLSSFLGGKMKELQLLDIGRDLYEEDFYEEDLYEEYKIEGLDIDVESILNAVQSPNLIWLRWNTGGRSSLPWILWRKLRVLEVSGRHLKTLWQEESQAPLELRKLEINAPLRDIPKSIGLLKHLEQIVIFKGFSGEVDLEKLPEEFCHLMSLKHLKIRSGRLRSLPESFGNLRNLQHLDLSLEGLNFNRRRGLDRLPESLGKPISLQHINLSRCSALKTLPDSFGNLINLQHLDLSGCNRLEWIPESFGNLRNLQHINLSRCSDLKRLPDSFGNLINLQHLDLSGCNRLEWIPESFGNLRNLQHINPSRCSDLKRLPDYFGNLINLQHLDLSGCNRLEWIPESFGNLRNLQHINLSRCSDLKRLPDSLGNLINLQHLDLSGFNRLEWIPESFGNLRNLQHINLSRCSDLKRLPDSFENLIHLQYINLSSCSVLKKLPDSFENLRHLQYINLSGCSALKRLLNSFGNLINLQYLDLTCNSKLDLSESELERLQDSCGNLIKLQYIVLPCNSFINLPGGSYKRE